MTEEFARWYLWAKSLAERHPEDYSTGLLVKLLGLLDDLHKRRRANPFVTALNLAEPLEKSIEMLVFDLTFLYPECPYPRD